MISIKGDNISGARCSENHSTTRGDCATIDHVLLVRGGRIGSPDPLTCFSVEGRDKPDRIQGIEFAISH